MKVLVVIICSLIFIFFIVFLRSNKNVNEYHDYKNNHFLDGPEFKERLNQIYRLVNQDPEELKHSFKNKISSVR